MKIGIAPNLKAGKKYDLHLSRIIDAVRAECCARYRADRTGLIGAGE